MSTAAEHPKVSQFTYLFIPTGTNQPVEELKFTGDNDDALRESIRNYFRKNSFSSGQREEMKKSLVEKAAANAAKNTVGGGGGGGTAVAETEEGGAVVVAPPTTTAAAASTTYAEIADSFLDDTSFEIVPVVMPTKATKFIGTSLYIDDAGRFKELPLNERASNIAQKDIRGDAFLLSNHDDPALDVWERVDCTKTRFDELMANPPTSTLDTSNQAAMAQATQLREQDARAITVEDATRGLQARLDGNQAFAAGDTKAAILAYAECIDLLEGRRDLHDNAAELDSARVSSFLNRSLCYGKLGKWSESLHDAQTAVELDPGNAKAYFRLASARAGLKEFDEALAAIKACEMTNGATAETAKLRQEILKAKSEFSAQQRSKYSKLFQ